MKAPPPPHYREGDPSEHCGNCRMYDRGKCWGYGDVSVKDEYVCDSWAPVDTKDATKHIWRAHRRALANAKEA